MVEVFPILVWYILDEVVAMLLGVAKMPKLWKVVAIIYFSAEENKGYLLGVPLLPPPLFSCYWGAGVYISDFRCLKVTS